MIITTQEPLTEDKKHDTKDDLRLFKEYQKTKVYNEEGELISFDLELRNKLAVRNQKLVLFVINKFFGYRNFGKDIKDDLLQEGTFGLFDAIDNFDPDLGYKFSTYCTHWVRQACSSFLLEESPQLQIPTHVRSNHNKVIKQLEKGEGLLTALNQEDASSRFGLTAKMLNNIKAAIRTKQIVSINDSVESQNNTTENTLTIGECLEALNVSAETNIDTVILVNAAKKALESLNDREKSIMLLRYNIVKDIPKNGEVK